MDDILSNHFYLKECSATIYVDDDNSDGPWDGTMDHPYQFIQDGIDKASNGDTVFVYNGTYNENIIVDRKIINLIGENKNTTMIDGCGLDTTVELSNTNNVILKNFFIVGSKNGEFNAGILISSTSECKVVNNIISNNNGRGLIIYGNSNQVINNSIEFNSWEGIYIRGDDNIIEDNIIIKNGKEAGDQEGDGIKITKSSHRTNIDYNLIGSNIADGVFIDEEASDTIIFKNIIENNGKCGICLVFCESTICKYNQIRGQKRGIRMYYSKFSEITYNNVYNNELNFYLTNSLNEIILCNNIYNGNTAEVKAELSVTFATSNYWGYPMGPRSPDVMIIRYSAIFIVHPWSTIPIPIEN